MRNSMADFDIRWKQRFQNYRRALALLSFEEMMNKYL